MIRAFKHHRSHAGTSFTKAVAICCATMRPVVISNWKQQQQTGAGSQA
jgi:hypothetical protein